jgi:hypothetical protein
MMSVRGFCDHRSELLQQQPKNRLAMSRRRCRV